MQALPSAGGAGGHGVLPDEFTRGVAEFQAPVASAGSNKRKRRPAGTPVKSHLRNLCNSDNDCNCQQGGAVDSLQAACSPDPGAEIVALSPQTLMESDRYVCEICNQGFQRDQNLQMHRRRHKVPWKLLKRPNQLATNKRVYICPERSCLHHDPAHALGDLVGIKKHYRRKHCTEKQWKCDRCCKRYAVQSDFKAHLKTCGTRGHCCDCGRVFSRVESFIEHQDTCSAVKRETTQLGSEFSERLKTSLPHQATDRNSTESPSQSSDTTQALSFIQSGMSDTAARFADTDSTTVNNEHSRRIQQSPAAAEAATPGAAMPAWLTQRPEELKRASQLLQPHHRMPTDQEVRASHGSRSQVTRCSSVTSAFPEVSCPKSKSTLEPSLLLSIGRPPSPAAPYVDAKPSYSSVERAVQQRETVTSSFGGMVPSSRPQAVDFNGLALSLPATVEGPGPGTEQHAALLSGFRMQAAGRRVGPAPQAESNAVVHEATKRRDQMFSSCTEMVDNFNPCAGSISSNHEDRAGGNVVHESDPPGMRPSRRGFTNSSQLEPATSSVITNRQYYLLHDHIDVAETDHLFAGNSKSVFDEAFRSHKQMPVAAAAARAEANQASEQARTDMNAVWSDLERVRRTKDEARQECEEAQREIARAETLKREAREQVQIASAVTAYADRAREFAKRQIEVSEAELAKAKRLREHAHSVLEKAASSQTGFSPQPPFCLSCRSTIGTDIILPRSTPTPPRSSTWSLMTAPPADSIDQLQAGTGQFYMVPAGLGVEYSADQAIDSLNPRMAWSKSNINIIDQMPLFNNSGEGSSYPWAAGFRSVSTLATSVAIGESDPSSGNNPLVASIRVSSPAGSDRQHFTHQDLDLN